MSIAWAINGTPAANLGISAISRALSSQNEDVVTLRADVASAFSEPLFAYDATVTITRDGAPWFSGVCKTLPRVATAQEETIFYRIVGAWYWLKTIYRQQHWAWNGTAVTVVNKSRVILCQAANGQRITSGQQIRAVIAYAISQGAPIALGTVDDGIELPWEEDRDLKCLEVIQRMLRWHPDWVAWFDYSLSPPVFHCRARANLTVASLAVGGAIAAIPSIVPRHDLVVAGVSITFEQVHTIDGLSGGSGVFHAVVTQEAGTMNAPETVYATVELSGMSKSYSTARLVTEIMPDEAGLAQYGFWAKHNAAIAQLNPADVSFTGVERADTAIDLTTGEISGEGRAYTKRLVEGQVAPWMGVGADETVVSALMHQTKRGALGADVGFDRVPVSVKFLTTNGGTKWYSRLESMEHAEEVPAGLADYMYAAWSTLHYQGTVELVAEDVVSTILPGAKLNLTGGRSEWATMAAMVQSVTEDVFTGRTVIEFGPPRQVSLDDIVSLLRRVRKRAASYSAGSRTSGNVSASGSVIEQAGPMAKVEPSSTPHEATALEVTAYGSEDAVEGKIILRPDSLTLRQVLVVEDVDGVKTMRPGWVRSHA